MKSVMLLMWISLIVVLNLRNNMANSDYLRICEQCNETTFPECPTEDPLPYNLTIFCQYPEENPCTIGVGAEASSDMNGTDFVCLIRNNQSPALDMQEVKEPLQTTMLPLALVLQMTTTETTQNLLDNVDEKANTVNMDNEDYVPSNIEVVPTAESMPLEVTNQPIQVSEYVLNEESPRPVETVTEMSQLTNEVPDMVTEVESILRSNESKDYQDDAPQPEEPTNPIKVEINKNEDKVMMMSTDKTEDVIEPMTMSDNKIEEKETSNTMEANEVTKEEKVTNSNEKESQANTLEEVLNNSNTDLTSSGSLNMHKCFGCTSSNDGNCIQKPLKEIDCKAMDGSPNGCYTLLKDGKLTRGCLNDAPELSACLDNTNKTCLACDSSGCNNEPWPQCFACESSEVEPSCSWWPASVSKKHWELLCSGYDDACISYIDTKGSTLRGCTPKTKQCPDEKETCRICTDPLCNGEVFPTSRRRCHQCSGTQQCAEAQSVAKALACPLYKPDDGCYFYVNGMGKMQRGCTSSIVQSEHCELAGSRCVKCVGHDSCNGSPLMVAPTLSCSHCDSRQKQVDCAWAQSNETVSACVNRYLYYLEESCQMIYDLDMELAVRGCSLDMGACEPTNEWCHTCSTNSCNMVNLQWEYCLECRSDEQSSCATDGNDVVLKKCGPTVYELRGCYTSKSVDTNITTRGCISELTEEGMNYCKSNAKLCSLCYEQGCNNRLAPSSAPQHAIAMTLILIASLFNSLV